MAGGRGQAQLESGVLLWAPCSVAGCSDLAARPIMFIHAL